MNYLAHLYFAEPTSESMAANLMGDFVKGRITEGWHPQLREGVLLHRRIDGYTDSHPKILECARMLSGRRRRYAGIILDICFDHYLCLHWQQFHPQPLDTFISDSYRLLQQYRGFMPEPMRQLLERMISQDWLGSYQDSRQIVRALDRVALRLRRPEPMRGAGEEFEQHYEVWQQCFLEFFPDLMRQVQQWQRQQQGVL